MIMETRTGSIENYVIDLSLVTDAARALADRIRSSKHYNSDIPMLHHRVSEVALGRLGDLISESLDPWLESAGDRFHAFACGKCEDALTNVEARLNGDLSGLQVNREYPYHIDHVPRYFLGELKGIVKDYMKRKVDDLTPSLLYNYSRGN